MRVAVVIATHRRALDVQRLLPHLLGQSQTPSRIVVSAVERADLPNNLPEHVESMLGSPGGSAQRNRAMEWLLADSDVIVFFDDDFIPSQTAIESIARLFKENPDIVGATGLVLADGVVQGGIHYSYATEVLAAHERGPRPAVTTRDTRRTYGCNMAFRASSIGDVRFDERLLMYAWQEDSDFAAQMSRNGRLVTTNIFSGVHLGVNRGRTPGLRLGYSQVANPLYLLRKGTMPIGFAAWLVLKSLLINHAKSFFPEPHIDRAGRAKGNRLALVHLAIGRMSPERILELGN